MNPKSKTFFKKPIHLTGETAPVILSEIASLVPTSPVFHVVLNIVINNSPQILQTCVGLARYLTLQMPKEGFLRSIVPAIPAS